MKRTMKRISEKDLEKLKHKDIVRFALFCAYQVESNWKNDPRCVKAVRVTELWLEGKASSEECRQVTGAGVGAAYVIHATICVAISNVHNITHAAAYAARVAAYAADYATAGAASIELIKAQWDYYYELLNFDKNFEKIVLGVK